MYPTKPIFIY